MTNITRNKTDLADLLALQIRGMGWPLPQREWLAIPHRKFRCDIAYPNMKFFIEVQGGEQQFGRHNRAAGMEADYEKWNLLMLAGWRGLIVTGSQVKSGAALAWLERYFQEHP